MEKFHMRFTNLTEKLKANITKIQFNLQTSFSLELVSFLLKDFTWTTVYFKTQK